MKRTHNRRLIGKTRAQLHEEASYLLRRLERQEWELSNFRKRESIFRVELADMRRREEYLIKQIADGITLRPESMLLLTHQRPYTMGQIVKAAQRAGILLTINPGTVEMLAQETIETFVRALEVTE